ACGGKNRAKKTRTRKNDYFCSAIRMSESEKVNGYPRFGWVDIDRFFQRNHQSTIGGVFDDLQQPSPNIAGTSIG
ncbi:MAG: hypothetical protein K5882_10305, partial [Bacteroidales bacterium]|nr:hypothetical protein [Bacteroidales bacterium]